MEVQSNKSKTEKIPLTDNEQYILEVLRSLRPFEEIKITADKMGKVNNFIIIRTQKGMLTDNGLIYA